MFDPQAVQLRLYSVNGKMVVCQSVVLQIYTVKNRNGLAVIGFYVYVCCCSLQQKDGVDYSMHVL